MTAVRRIIAGAAAVIVILGVTILAFFNPFWIGFEQGRADVPALTGYTSTQVEAVTTSILGDLLLGPPDFAVTVDGQPALDAAERSHMVDVRNVVLPALIVFAIAVAVLAWLLATGWRDAWLWRAIALGSGALAAFGVAVGIAVVFFFDAAFLVFHLVFFPAGNFSFDPRTERLTQLFPDQLWTETSVGIAATGLIIASTVAFLARWRAARLAT